MLRTIATRSTRCSRLCLSLSLPLYRRFASDRGDNVCVCARACSLCVCACVWSRRYTHPDTLTTACNLADTLTSQGRHREAEALCRSTLASQAASLGEGHPSSLVTMVVLARALDGQRAPHGPCFLRLQPPTCSARMRVHTHAHTRTHTPAWCRAALDTCGVSLCWH